MVPWAFRHEIGESCSICLYTKFLNVGGMDYDVVRKLYESLVEPVLLYGAGLWGLSEQKRVNTVQNKVCRYFLGRCKNASNLASGGDMGWSICAHKQEIESFRLYFKIERTPEHRLVNKIFRWSSMHGKSWERRFQSFMWSNNLHINLSSKYETICEKLG